MQFFTTALNFNARRNISHRASAGKNGVTKIRLTGGEPLTRKGMVGLCEKIAALPNLKELVITTNGSQLTQYAKPLLDAGVKRLNISLDTLNAERFKTITPQVILQQVLDGIFAAKDAGFKQIKLQYRGA